MKNNNTKHNIMKNLTLTILSFFLIHSYSNAAIVYTDVSPDKTLNNSFILIDLNNFIITYNNIIFTSHTNINYKIILVYLVTIKFRHPFIFLLLFIIIIIFII